MLQPLRVQRYGHTHTLFTTITSNIKGEFVSLLPFRGRIPVIINKTAYRLSASTACRNIYTAGILVIISKLPSACRNRLQVAIPPGSIHMPDALRPYWDTRYRVCTLFCTIVLWTMPLPSHSKCTTPHMPRTQKPGSRHTCRMHYSP